MKTTNQGITVIAFLSVLLLPLVVLAEQGSEPATEGSLSLATNPQVMVYIDGHRVGVSPLINHRLAAGEHRLSLLLIRPDGQRMRAEYRALIEPAQTTMASLNLVDQAPVEGEVGTLAPEPPVAVAVPAPPPAPPPVVEAPRQPMPPVDVAVVIRPNPTVAVDAPPQPLVDASRPVPQPQIHGLSRELVREGMEALRPVVERCMGGSTGLLNVRVIIQPDGGISEVEAQGIFRGTDIAACIERDFPEEAAFPIYSGDPIPVVYPYRVTGD